MLYKLSTLTLSCSCNDFNSMVRVTEMTYMEFTDIKRKKQNNKKTGIKQGVIALLTKKATKSNTHIYLLVELTNRFETYSSSYSRSNI